MCDHNVDALTCWMERTAIWGVVASVTVPVPDVAGIANVEHVGSNAVIIYAWCSGVDAGEEGPSAAGSIIVPGCIVPRVVTRVTGALAAISTVII